MATTAKQLIEAAFSRSTFNDPESLATRSELIGVIDRRLKALYSLATEANEFYFGDILTVAPTSGAWLRPDTAETVHRVEVSAVGTGPLAVGQEVFITPFDDQQGEMAPAIYQFGRKYYPSGRVGSDPNGTETLKFFVSKTPASLDSSLAWDNAANTLDADWPEQFNDLLVLDLSRYLATKDGRGEEVQLLRAEEADIMAVFLKHLSHENNGMRSRWGQRSRAGGNEKG